MKLIRMDVSENIFMHQRWKLNRVTVQQWSQTAITNKAWKTEHHSGLVVKLSMALLGDRWKICTAKRNRKPCWAAAGSCCAFTERSANVTPFTTHAFVFMTHNFSTCHFALPFVNWIQLLTRKLQLLKGVTAECITSGFEKNPTNWELFCIQKF